MIKLIIHSIIVILFMGKLIAQQTPAPGQKKPVILIGGTAHLGNGGIIKNAIIGFEKGKIYIIGDASSIQINNKEAEVINIQGKQVYPGLIAPNTHIGLAEIDQVSATKDFDELGLFNPNIRSIIAYNTDSRVTPTIRSNGVLLAQVAPKGGRISGTSSIVELDGWNWEDAAYKMDEGIYMNWPNLFTRGGWWGEPEPTRQNKKWENQVQAINDFFNVARAYSEKLIHKNKNIKFEAMRGLFNKSKTLYIRANHARIIISAVNFIKKYNLRGVIVGARDSWKVIDILKENDIPVIYSSVHSLPASDDADIDQPFKTPYLLEQAGVTYCISMDGSWGQRNLMFTTGTAISYGLDREKALAAVTGNTAKILGIADRVGTLEKGKDATLIISTGDLFDMRTSNIELAFIRGKKIDLDNKQKALYRKFSQKYNLED